MSNEEFLKIIADDISKIYTDNVDALQSKLFENIKPNATLEEIIPIITMRSIQFSVQMSAQYVLKSLVDCGLIPLPEQTFQKPQLRIVWDSSKNQYQNN